MRAAFFRVEIESDSGEVLSAIVPRGPALYRAPSWLRERTGGTSFKWRVTALDLLGRELSHTEWRNLKTAGAAQ
jgi:hypothetical protein